MKLVSSRGTHTPLGSSATEKGVNFAVISHHTTAIFLRLFERNANDFFAEFPMKRSGNTWHLEIQNLPEIFEYTYRCEGPYFPEKGHLFNPEMELIDPYAKALNSSSKWGEVKRPVRSRYEPSKFFDWECIGRPLIPKEDLIIYEMHVRSFTQHISSGVSKPGTFRGILEKIPYLKELGVNAIELMPIYEFNETENQKRSPKSGRALCNYWGYSTVNFFTPMKRYGTAEDLKCLVKGLHGEGIEIFLDVVYNHTSEGDDSNYYSSFRGLDNALYYITDENGYHNYSGCGNTLKCQHPVVQDLILDSLKYWVTEFHIDGFRFDLAPILTRDEGGSPLENPPLIKRITDDPILAPTKLIAEPWDAAGLYQVGTFPSWKFSEWNGKFRDDVRRFLRGGKNSDEMKNCLLGSPDIYQKKGSPLHSINFITAHDGFSLRDLVSYNKKRNACNGEHNRDGADHNESWNCGVEGETDHAQILELRAKQMRNFMLALLTSQGIPMILMGDEHGHTRGGNNNAWSQDNEQNYFLWGERPPLFTFTKTLIELRKKYALLRQKNFTSKAEWEEGGYLGLNLSDELFIAFNPTHAPCFLEKSKWQVLIDTAHISIDPLPPTEMPYELRPFSSVLFCKKESF